MRQTLESLVFAFRFGLKVRIALEIWIASARMASFFMIDGTFAPVFPKLRGGAPIPNSSITISSNCIHF
jgi:hypothetical protein